MFLMRIVCVCVVFTVASSEELIEYIRQSEIPELEYLNTSVDPCDNFYEFTCGNFKNVKPIPDDKIIWDHFNILQQEIHQLIKVILETELSHNDSVALRKAKLMYSGCTNTKYQSLLALAEDTIVKTQGGWPLVPSYYFPTSILTWNHIADLISEYGVPMFFKIDVLPNLVDATKTVVYISKDNVVNPSIRENLETYDDYLELPKPVSSSRNKRNAQSLPFFVFLKKVALRLKEKLYSRIPEDTVDQEIGKIIDFMLQVKRGGITNGTQGTISFKTVEQLQSWTEDNFGKEFKLNWLEFLNRVFKRSGKTLTKHTEIMIADLTALSGVLTLMKQSSPNMWRNFVMTRLFTYTAPDSDGPMRRAFKQFYKDQKWPVYKRSDYCVRKVMDFPGFIGLSFALAHEYQKYHFNINKIKIALDMVNDLHSAFSDILHDSDWIDDVTKQKALEKQAKMLTLLAYPKLVEDPVQVDKYYKDLKICSWDHFGNSQRLRAFRQAKILSQIGEPTDRNLWQISPLEANAYYNGQLNRILFPISMLNQVFYTGGISAIDYSRIGAIIGHEITHGFDNQGRSYDGDGTVHQWWTRETLAKFTERQKCFENQYNKYYIPEIDAYINATTTMRENLADNGGLREAYKAFQKQMFRAPPVFTVEPYTPEQLFFIGYGTMWCMTETSEYLRKQHNIGSYSPGRYRVIGTVSNMDEFSEAFQCPLGSNMNPKNKCILW